MYMDCAGDEGKYNYLSNLYGAMTVGSSIIFVKVRISIFSPSILAKSSSAPKNCR